jgi:NADP-dependent 3-hydroxy acid dehydrogenase YdfG
MAGIEGKIVAITGASSGIGEATALLLVERGAKLVLGARGSDRVKALADRITQSGGDVAYLATDVRKRADLTALVNLACEKFGKLDVIFNNAGVRCQGDSLVEISVVTSVISLWTGHFSAALSSSCR